MATLNEILQRYNIKDVDLSLIKESLTHSSYANEHKCLSNERLEFLGDAVLSIKVSEYIYLNNPDLPEGQMTKLRATYVCEDANYKYAEALGLSEALFLGHGEELGGGRIRPAVLNDAFEAFLAAVYLTCGMDKVTEILEDIVFPHIGRDTVKPFVDYKSRLQEYIQAESRSILAYRLDDSYGPPHDRTFKISVLLDGIKLGEGVGKSKKEAEQLAAKSALEKMVK